MRIVTAFNGRQVHSSTLPTQVKGNVLFFQDGSTFNADTGQVKANAIEVLPGDPAYVSSHYAHYAGVAFLVIHVEADEQLVVETTRNATTVRQIDERSIRVATGLPTGTQIGNGNVQVNHF